MTVEWNSCDFLGDPFDHFIDTISESTVEVQFSHRFWTPEEFNSFKDNTLSILDARDSGRFRRLEKISAVFRADEHIESTIAEMTARAEASGILFEAMCDCEDQANGHA